MRVMPKGQAAYMSFTPYARTASVDGGPLGDVKATPSTRTQAFHPCMAQAVPLPAQVLSATSSGPVGCRFSPPKNRRRQAGKVPVHLFFENLSLYSLGVRLVLLLNNRRKVLVFS